MDKLTRNLTIGVVILILMVGGILLKMPVLNSGDVSLSLGGGGGDYYYKHFSGSIASTTALKSITGSFGGIVINEDSAVAVTFYDATSTTAYSITNATTIAIVQASQAEGVYIYNAGLSKGLVMSCDGFTFAGDWTVLWD